MERISFAAPVRACARSAKSRYAAATAFALAASLSPNPLSAAVHTWNAGNGNWNTAANWSPVGVPAAGDTANIVFTDGLDRTVTYDYPGSITLSLLTLDLTNAANAHTTTLNLTANNLTVATEYIGYSGGGSNGTATFTQSGGAHTITSTGNGLFLAVNATDHGFYNLSSTASLVSSNFECIGYAGIGVFTQDGGSNTLNSANGLFLGGAIFAAGGNGTYALNAGSLASNGPEYIGYSNTSVGFFNQNGGNNTFVGASTNLIVGNAATASGTYTLSGGNLTYNYSAAGSVVSEIIGNFGTGAFVQFGGVNTVNNLGNTAVELGNAAGSNGTYTLYGGSLICFTFPGTPGEVVGGTGTGTFNHFGGINSTTGLFLGFFAGSTGTYNLSGSSTLTNTGNEYIGVSGNGNFFQSGGIHTSTASAFIAVLPGSTGSYTISDGIWTIGNGSSALDIDNGGTGVLTINGSGTVNVLGSLIAHPRPGSMIHLDGGTLNVESLNLNGTPSLLSWTSGTLNITQDTTFDSASTVTSAAFGPALDLNYGQTLKLTGNETLGGTGPFALTVEYGANHTVSGTLTLAILGSLTLNSGTINANALNFNGTLPNFHWNYGTLNLNANVVFDSFAAPTSTSAAFGQSLILGGSQTLSITGNETLGGAGPFYLTLYGGACNTVTGNVTISTTGIVNAYGGTINAPSVSLSGGTINGSFINPAGTTFIYNSGNFYADITNNGTATFNNTFNPYYITNNGLLLLAGATLNTDVLNNSIISGYGTINSGNLTNEGDIQLTPAFTLNAAPSGVLTNDGAIHLNGGTLLSNNTINSPSGTIAGNGTLNSTFFTNDGLLEVDAGQLRITNPFDNTGTIQLNGAAASLSANFTNSSTVQGFGRITGNITNNGTIEATGGTLTLAATPLVNNGTLRATTGSKILIQGAAAFPINAGLIDLAGGTLDTNNRPLNNTGQISGYGVLSTGGLTNNGAFTLTGGTSTVNGPVTNSAGKTLNIKYQPALFTGNITNLGTIKVTSTTVTFTGNYTGNTYISDPATNIFQANATTIPGGLMSGGPGDVFSFNTFTNNGTFTNGGNLSVSTAITNTGTFTQSGPQSWSPGATFTNTAGAATFSSNAKLYGLSITGGTVDLTTSKFIIETTTSKSATLTALQSNIASGALTSSTLPQNFALALLDNALLNLPAFGSSPADSNSLLLAPELLGDANIDGKVDLADLSTLLHNFGTATPLWNLGNFDHTSTINLTDLSYVLNNFGQTNPNPTTSQLPTTNDQVPAPAPEPASLLALFPALVLLQKRRR